MPTEIINILVQLPIVAVFIWYTDRINKQFQEFLRDQRDMDRQMINRMAAQVERVADTLDKHDDDVRSAIVQMEERTRPRKPDTGELKK